MSFPPSKESHFCPYEILQVEPSASEEQIKKAYRAKALLLHPDKNPLNIQEATKQFTLLQKAWEILSDPSERAWFDSHREQKTKGTTEFHGKALDLMRWFDPSAFSGMDDSESGFYTVYQRVFDHIIDYEIANSESKLERSDFPSFGSKDSQWEPEVKVFYAFWSGFCSRAKFAYAEKYKVHGKMPMDVPRFARREAEKENKKAREERRKYSETVKRLVEFVKRRDLRIRQAKQQQQPNFKKVSENSQAKERIDSVAPSSLQTFEAEYARLLEEMEQEGACGMEEEFFCFGCEVSFGNQEDLQAQEDGIVHRMNVMRLQEEMLLEEQQLEAKKALKKASKKEKNSSSKEQSQIECKETDLKLRQNASKLTLEEKRQKRNERQAKREMAALTCQICKQQFASRTKLFQHLEKDHHSSERV